jgi:MoaA/NifB/PqqE/SkfB family radical SAM enzyme
MSISSRPSAAPGIQKLTLMLTELCNLDCWMCDFGVRNKRNKKLPLSVDQILDLLGHPVFAPLQGITLTGGEPFLFGEIQELYRALRDRMPRLKVCFSSNTTSRARMFKVFDEVADWSRVALFVSVDGIEKHDEQRGKEGSFELTFGNLEAIRARYPSLPIRVKFTITPVNFMEVEKTFRYFSSRGYEITAKLVENNQFYTNNLSVHLHQADFSFSPAQLDSIRNQLNAIQREWPPGANPHMKAQVEEALSALDPEWKRGGRCVTPERAAFIDCDLNLFTCKEYGPVLNLQSDDLGKLRERASYLNVVEHEECNTGRCTRCTSQMKMPVRERNAWFSANSLVR